MKNIIRLTEADLMSIITESVKKVLNEVSYKQAPKLDSDENHGYHNSLQNESAKKHIKEDFDRVSRTIQLPCNPSTVAIMEYIRDNGMPSNELWDFSFKNGDAHMCSEVQPNSLETVLEAFPLEEWPDVLGMKRIKLSGWYCYINNKFYYIS